MPKSITPEIRRAIIEYFPSNLFELIAHNAVFILLDIIAFMFYDKEALPFIKFYHCAWLIIYCPFAYFSYSYIQEWKVYGFADHHNGEIKVPQQGILFLILQVSIIAVSYIILWLRIANK